MTKVKICGITSAEDLKSVQRLGAHYAGFVFYPGSPRYVAPETVQEWISLKNDSCRWVGVFVDESEAVILEIARSCRLDIVQLHGHETVQFCRSLDISCWKALRIREISGLEAMDRYPEIPILLDAYSPEAYGGTGRALPLEIAEEALKRKHPLILAGGISPETLHSFLELSPFAVDASSSLEERPGKKSPERLEAFFHRYHQFEKSFQ